MKQPKIVVLDYDAGNVFSVFSAIKYLGYKKLSISSLPSELKTADALVLPGVGAFSSCIGNLKKLHLDLVLNELVLIKKIPIFGICVGMQLMSRISYENGTHDGLNWIEGEVVRLDPQMLSVPHVGWNVVNFNPQSRLFSRMNGSGHFYFDHSYHYQTSVHNVVAHCEYGVPVTAAIQKDHIFGVQFHPEKSQNNGLRIFKAFFSLVEQC